ncbi:MAG: 4Fe-4S binding protein, partial [Desulfovibrio sp.]|nr:4Fe-4S binding protein [Desulfovibrio sp.]
MEAVRATQDVSVSDLAWKIDYDIQRCTLCGSCIAACTFGAIEAGVLRLERRDSQAPFPGQAGQNGNAGKAAETASSHG